MTENKALRLRIWDAPKSRVPRTGAADLGSMDPKIESDGRGFDPLLNIIHKAAESAIGFHQILYRLA